MNIEELASLAEIVGGVVVIISLIYLARQVRENSLQSKLASSIALNHLINEAFDPIYNNDRNIHVWTSGISDPSSLSAEDRAVFSLFMARLVVVLRTAVMHNKSDLLVSEVGRLHLGSLNSILNSPGGQFWQKEQGGNAFLDDAVREVLKSNAEYQDSLVFTASAYAEANNNLIVLLDRSLGMLEKGRKRLTEICGSIPNHIAFIQGDIFKLPFHNSAFDVVISNGVMHIFNEKELILTEFSRVNSSRGTISFSSLVGNNRLGRMYLSALRKSGEVATVHSSKSLSAELQRVPFKYEVTCIGNMAYAKSV